MMKICDFCCKWDRLKKSGPVHLCGTCHADTRLRWRRHPDGWQATTKDPWGDMFIATVGKSTGKYFGRTQSFRNGDLPRVQECPTPGEYPTNDEGLYSSDGELTLWGVVMWAEAQLEALFMHVRNLEESNAL